MAAFLRATSLMLRASMFQTTRPVACIPTRGLEEFFAGPAENKYAEDGKRVPIGRAWKAKELRLKSFEDLHKLWYVCLKERNMLLSERERLGRYDSLNAHIPYRMKKVKRTMGGIKQVLGERQREYKGAMEDLKAKNLLGELPEPSPEVLAQIAELSSGAVATSSSSSSSSSSSPSASVPSASGAAV